MEFNRQPNAVVAERLDRHGFSIVSVVHGSGIGQAEAELLARASALHPDAFVSLHHETRPWADAQ